MPVTSAFFDDLSGTLERVVEYNEPIYIVGDLIVLLDRDNDSNAHQLTGVTPEVESRLDEGMLFKP